MKDVICGTAAFIAPLGLAWLSIALRASARRRKRQALRRPTGLRLHADFLDLPL